MTDEDPRYADLRWPDYQRELLDVVRILSGRGAWVGVDAVCEHVGRKRRSVSQTLGNLAKRGRLERRGRGAELEVRPVPEQPEPQDGLW